MAICIILFIVSLSCALGMSAICSLCEATLLSLSAGQVEKMIHINKRKGLIWQQFKRNMRDPISVILFVNTAAHTIGATVAGAQFQILFHNQYLTAFSVIFSWLMLQYTEIMPKTIGVRYNMEIAFITAVPLQMLIRVMLPIIRVIRYLNRPFESRQKSTPLPATDEITALAAIARIRKFIDANQERIFQQTALLQHRDAYEVMIPVTQIKYLSSDMSLSQAVDAVHQDPHTRFPVIDHQDINHILGYVNFKELIAWARTNPNDATVIGIKRQVRFIEPTEELTDVLKLFVNEHAHMAIVTSGDVNNQGAGGETLGLITLEDILEELLGELEDEFDGPYGSRRSYATKRRLEEKKTDSGTKK